MRLVASFSLVLAGCASPAIPRTLSPLDIVGAAGLARVGESAEAAYQRIAARIGPPGSIGPGRLSWGARAGDDCYLLEIGIDEWGTVRWVNDPYSPEVSGDSGAFCRCAAAAPP